MSKYLYRESRTITKKLTGFYDANSHTIDVDGESKNIVDELKVFNGSPIEVVVKIKEETDLSDE